MVDVLCRYPRLEVMMLAKQLIRGGVRCKANEPSGEFRKLVYGHETRRPWIKFLVRPYFFKVLHVIFDHRVVLIRSFETVENYANKEIDEHECDRKVEDDHVEDNGAISAPI